MKHVLPVSMPVLAPFTPRRSESIALKSIPVDLLVDIMSGALFSYAPSVVTGLFFAYNLGATVLDLARVGRRRSARGRLERVARIVELAAVQGRRLEGVRVRALFQGEKASGSIGFYVVLGRARRIGIPVKVDEFSARILGEKGAATLEELLAEPGPASYAAAGGKAFLEADCLLTRYDSNPYMLCPLVTGCQPKVKPVSETVETGKGDTISIKVEEGLGVRGVVSVERRVKAKSITLTLYARPRSRGLPVTYTLIERKKLRSGDTIPFTAPQAKPYTALLVVDPTHFTPLTLRDELGEGVAGCNIELALHVAIEMPLLTRNIEKTIHVEYECSCPSPSS